MKVLMLVSSLDSFAKGTTDGFIVDWVRVLASKVDHLTVLTYRHNPKEKFPQNTKICLISGANFLTRNLSLIVNTYKLSKECDVIFAHILEIFGIVSGIVGKLTRKKTFLWYCQGYNLSKHFMAKTALFFVDKVFTSTPEIRARYITEVGNWVKNKTIVVGHGIYLSHYD